MVAVSTSLGVSQHEPHPHLANRTHLHQHAANRTHHHGMQGSAASKAHLPAPGGPTTSVQAKGSSLARAEAGHATHGSSTGSLLARCGVASAAIYFPGFHHSVDNDIIWGYKWTEWDNLADADDLSKPLAFDKAAQNPVLHPRRGYYDIADREARTMRAQAAEAKAAGIQAFMIYHYVRASSRGRRTHLVLCSDHLPAHACSLNAFATRGPARAPSFIIHHVLPLLSSHLHSYVTRVHGDSLASCGSGLRTVVPL